MNELVEILDQGRALVEDPDFPAVRQWLETNPSGKVLGHFQVYFPEELAHAGGVFPLKLAGAGSEMQINEADAHVAAFVCSIVRSSLELALTGRLDFLSAFVTMPICDAARHSCGVWARSSPALSSQILYLPQNASSRGAVRYLTDEYRRILRLVEDITGRRVSDEALRNSIALFNDNRRLLRELYRLKREAPWKVSAVETYILTRLAGLMPREDHNALLRRALPLLSERAGKPQDKIRVLFQGGFCEQPPIDMLAVIQDSCYLVDDDLLVGLRWISEDVLGNGDPVEALARAYLESSSYSPVQHDPRKPKAKMLLRDIRKAEADAAILAAAKMCEPGLEEQVGYFKALDEAGIPNLIIEFEEKDTAFERLRMEVETFTESLLFEFA